MGTTPYTIRLDDDVKKKLEHEARMEDRPPAQLAVMAIKSMLSARRAKREAIEASIERANKGVFISAEAILSWVDTWSDDQDIAPPEPDIRP